MNEKKRLNFSIPLPTRQTLRRLLHWLTPNGGTLLILALFFFAQTAGAIPLPARQSAPNWPTTPTINYQGRLANSAGDPISDTVAMQFSFYDSDASGTLLWGPETHPTVEVAEGLFSVALGQLSGGIPTSVLSGDIWLEITVDGETLSPREQLRAVPYAMQSSVALTVPDGAIGTSQIADGAITSVKAPNLLQGPGANHILKTGSYIVVGTSNTEFDIPLGYSFPNQHVTFIAFVSAYNQSGGVYVRVSSAAGNDKGHVRMSVPVSGHIQFDWIAIGN